MNPTNSDNAVNRPEQIKKQSLVSGFVFKSVKQILEKDEFNLFNTSTTLDLDNKIRITDNKIEELIQIKLSGESQSKSLNEQVGALKQENSNLQETLKTEIGN